MDAAAIRNHAARLLHHATKAEGLREAGADDSGEMREARRHLVACAPMPFDCFVDPMDEAARAGVEGREAAE